MVVNQREGCQQVFALPYVHSVHEQYVKLHEQHYLIYIKMIDFQMTQKSIRTTCPILVHKPVHYDINIICDVEIFVVQLTH